MLYEVNLRRLGQVCLCVPNFVLHPPTRCQGVWIGVLLLSSHPRYHFRLDAALASVSEGRVAILSGVWWAGGDDRIVRYRPPVPSCHFMACRYGIRHVLVRSSSSATCYPKVVLSPRLVDVHATSKVWHKRNGTNLSWGEEGTSRRFRGLFEKRLPWFSREFFPDDINRDVYLKAVTDFLNEVFDFLGGVVFPFEWVMIFMMASGPDCPAVYHHLYQSAVAAPALRDWVVNMMFMMLCGGH